MTLQGFTIIKNITVIKIITVWVSALSVKSEIKWGERQRLEFLEHELFWAGRINRTTLATNTGTSLPQASLDIKSYKNLAPENLVYDLTEKAYLATPNFSPVFIATSPRKFLSNLPIEIAEEITLPYREISPEILRDIHQAVLGKSWVEIDYRSLSSDQTKKRNIAPHSFVCNGARWHVRAYDFLTGSFRDFVLGRIEKAAKAELDSAAGEHKWKKEHDADWNSEITLCLQPHPGLSKSQKQTIENDYCMKNSQVEYKVRRSNLLYVVDRLRLVDEVSDPAIQQLVLTNKAEVARLLR